MYEGRSCKAVFVVFDLFELSPLCSVMKTKESHSSHLLFIYEVWILIIVTTCHIYYLPSLGIHVIYIFTYHLPHIFSPTNTPQNQIFTSSFKTLLISCMFLPPHYLLDLCSYLLALPFFSLSIWQLGVGILLLITGPTSYSSSSSLLCMSLKFANLHVCMYVCMALC